MKRLGIEGIYLGGWATSAKGSRGEDPGADLASYPLSQVPDEAAPIVRMLLAADKNQHFARARMSAKQLATTPVTDFRPFIIADADTGHGGDAHVRNLIRRFVEVGVPGYHIEDQKPGVKKCGHQGGKVLVPQDEQIKRLNAARFQLDIMGVPGIVVARTDAESATFIDGCGDERDQPFILGATNLDLPGYKVCNIAILKMLHDLGVGEARGHLLYAISDVEYAAAFAWLERTGVASLVKDAAAAWKGSKSAILEQVLDPILTRCMDAWQAEAGLKTYGQAVADVMSLRLGEGERFDLSVEEWRAFARKASFYAAREKARSLGVVVPWDCEPTKTPEGYYQVENGIEYAAWKSLAVAPFADLLWMETKTADLADARQFAEAIHAEFPDKMLAYNLSPSFSWDTTGMTDVEMRRFPEELGKLGYVFNFVTYGGHQIDGLAGEEFAAALRQDGMLALARLQRKFRLLESPYRTPQTLVGGPRLDGALMASTGHTAATKAMGKGSQVSTCGDRGPAQAARGVARAVGEALPASARAARAPAAAHLRLRGSRTGAVQPEEGGRGERPLRRHPGPARPQHPVGARPEHLRRGPAQEAADDPGDPLPDPSLQGFLGALRRPDGRQRVPASKMKAHGIFREVRQEVGHIIVAEVDRDRIAELLEADGKALMALIDKTGPPPT
jgi:isocitrate lyase